MSDTLAIQALHLGKCYVLGSGRPRHNSLRDVLADRVGSLLRRRAPEAAQEPFWALRNATFEIRHGENVGIVGLNGAGKSTLLKILSRITEPTAGRARLDGRVGALLEVGTGFHWELTGRENVFLYGSILGMRKQEIRRKFAAIVEFAGIPRFIDTPVKRYSSGMYVRLAFSVAAHLEPEILLLDEVLAVGDLAFQRKCIEFARGLQRRNATILFVSHNMFSIKTMCDRVIYLKSGRVAFDGEVERGIKMYEKDCVLSTVSWTDTKPGEWPLRIEQCQLLGNDGVPKTVFDFGEPLTVRLTYATREPLEYPNFIIVLIRSDGVACCNFSSEVDGLRLRRVEGRGQLELQTPPLKLVSDTYRIEILVREKAFQRILCGQVGGTLHVRHELFNTHFGVFHEPATWRTDLADVLNPTTPAEACNVQR